MGFWDLFKTPKVEVKVEAINKASKSIIPPKVEPSENGLSPTDILMLHYAPKYTDKTIDFPQFWHCDYYVKPRKVLEKLLNEGFITFASYCESLQSLKLDALKEICGHYGIVKSGKKADIIERIQQTLSEKELKPYFDCRHYALTPLGSVELKHNQYVVYLHTHPSLNISIYDIPLKMRSHYRDFIWGIFQERLFEYANNRHEISSIRYNIYEFRKEENPTPEELLSLYCDYLIGHFDSRICSAKIFALAKGFDFNLEALCSMEFLGNELKEIFLNLGCETTDDLFDCLSSISHSDSLFITKEEFINIVFLQISGDIEGYSLLCKKLQPKVVKLIRKYKDII